MPKKRYTPEEIVAKLRQVDVLVSQGQNIADAIRQIGVAACIARLQATSPRGVRACIRRVAGCATSTSFASHASTEAGLELTLHLDHPMGSHQGDHALGACLYKLLPMRLDRSSGRLRKQEPADESETEYSRPDGRFWQGACAG